MTTPKKHHLDRRADTISVATESADDDELLTTAQTASLLGVSLQWMEIGRSRGYGPHFTKLSPRCVRYRRVDIRAWLRSRTHASTAEYAR
jgi:predicted DNA-binding transcriptional regulator AlpA